jgi:hypothetical protein
MDSGSPVGRFAAHEAPEALGLRGLSRRLRRNLWILRRILREHRLNQEPLSSERARLWLGGVAIFDMVAVAWGIAGLDRLDQTSTLGSAITLGGHPRLVLIMSVVGFAMLAGLAPLTKAFSRATELEFALLIVACVISVVALAGALSAILLLVLACALGVMLLVALIALLVIVIVLVH